MSEVAPASSEDIDHESRGRFKESLLQNHSSTNADVDCNSPLITLTLRHEASLGHHLQDVDVQGHSVREPRGTVCCDLWRHTLLSHLCLLHVSLGCAFCTFTICGVHAVEQLDDGHLRISGFVQVLDYHQARLVPTFVKFETFCVRVCVSVRFVRTHQAAKSPLIPSTAKVLVARALGAVDVQSPPKGSPL